MIILADIFSNSANSLIQGGTLNDLSTGDLNSCLALV